MSESADSINDTILSITQQVKETEENFVFQTLKSYSENIVEREVSKKDLSRAIINYFNTTPIEIRQGRLTCNNCYTNLHLYRHELQGLDYIYCYKCGRRMKLR